MKIFFPPRLIDADESIADSNARLDDAVAKYVGQGITILVEEESLKDAIKVIEFAEGFKDMVRPPDEKR